MKFLWNIDNRKSKVLYQAGLWQVFRITFICQLIVCAFFIPAQKSVAQTGKKTANEIRMLLTGEKAIYSGSGNPFVVILSGKSTMNVEMKISNGFISRGDTCWFAQVDTGKMAEIKVYVRSGGKEVKAGTFKFPVKRLPPPEPSVCNKTNGDTLTKESLLKNARLNVQMQGMIPGKVPVFTICSFSMTISGVSSATSMVAKGDGKFTDKQITMLKKARSGAKISFENIQAKAYDGTISALSPMIVNLK